jgi:hypothetical protein
VPDLNTGHFPTCVKHKTPSESPTTHGRHAVIAESQSYARTSYAKFATWYPHSSTSITYDTKPKHPAHRADPSCGSNAAIAYKPNYRSWTCADATTCGSRRPT